MDLLFHKRDVCDARHHPSPSEQALVRLCPTSSFTLRRVLFDACIMTSQLVSPDECFDLQQVLRQRYSSTCNDLCLAIRSRQHRTVSSGLPFLYLGSSRQPFNITGDDIVRRLCETGERQRTLDWLQRRIAFLADLIGHEHGQATAHQLRDDNRHDRAVSNSPATYVVGFERSRLAGSVAPHDEGDERKIDSNYQNDSLDLCSP